MMEDETVQMRLLVHAHDATYQQTPVWVPLTRRVPETPLALMEGANPISAQVVVKDGKRWLVWIEPDLPKGTRKQYLLRPHPKRLAGFQHSQTERGIEIRYQEKPFTTYVTQGAPKPYLFPVYGPTGKMMTRRFPMEIVQGETIDHPHHRSIWFTHGDVNGVDFWTEGAGKGKVVHREVVSAESGLVLSRLIVRNEWLAPNNKKLLNETTEMVFYATPEARWMDYQVTLTASDEEVRLGDTKEGTFGIRVACPMEVTRKQGGQIVNSAGQRDRDAWGKRAEWCDYTGIIEEETLGIAIFDHPQNLRHPTYWHVRDYGLFAVNPFGIHDFVPGTSKGTGDHVIPKGGSLTLRYRVYFHKGRTEEAKVAQHYSAYRYAPEVTFR